jgi:hypothetical protein
LKEKHDQQLKNPIRVPKYNEPLDAEVKANAARRDRRSTV